MSFERPTLSQLIARIEDDITAMPTGTSGLLPCRSTCCTGAPSRRFLFLRR